MNHMKEINHTELEKVHGGAGFDPFTGEPIADPIPLTPGKKPGTFEKLLGDIKNFFGF